MPLAYFTDSKGQQFEAEIKVGETLMQGAKNNMIDEILAECGGSCTCGTCHIYIDEEWNKFLPELTEQEKIIINGTVLEPKSSSRLSCQIQMTESLDGITIKLPKSQY